LADCRHVASLQKFLSTAQRRERTIKRGGLCTFTSLDAQAVENRHRLEPADDLALTAEQMFDARWALTLLNKAMASVQAQYAARGKEKIFETLKGFLPGGSRAEPGCCQEAAATPGVSEASLNALIHRLRQQYSVALRREVARIVSVALFFDDRDADCHHAHCPMRLRPRAGPVFLKLFFKFQICDGK
jgi:hypothetical protein